MNLRIFSLLIFLSSNFFASAQDTLTLDQSYQELLRTSETYEVYKVIRSERLNGFWSSVMDSIAVQEKEISELKSSLDNQRAEVASFQQQVAEVQARSSELETQVDTISFLGMPMGKGVYHSLVWAIIAGLAIVLAVIMWRFQESHRVTAKAKKELDALQAEFENHREKARAKQVKLKRELQTAVNELEARKRGEV